METMRPSSICLVRPLAISTGWIWRLKARPKTPSTRDSILFSMPLRKPNEPYPLALDTRYLNTPYIIAASAREVRVSGNAPWDLSETSSAYPTTPPTTPAATPEHHIPNHPPTAAPHAPPDTGRPSPTPPPATPAASPKIHLPNHSASETTSAIPAHSTTRKGSFGYASRIKPALAHRSSTPSLIGTVYNLAP